MAFTEFPPATFDPTYLNASEQDLLTTALSSNNSSGKGMGVNGTPQNSKPRSNTLGTNGTSEFYTSPIEQTPGSGNFDQTPFLDYELDEANFEWDVEGQMIGDLPEGEDEDETGDKRKNPTDEDGSGKRRTSEDKANKKPGRKPLTSEPTSKRKAQNRAAQRAFRERKERHLKELESKVEDLEKASESANHENGLLRAQVERLQTELREYRKRLSLNSTSNTRSSPQSSGSALSSKSQWDINNNFQFAFPRFGPFGGESNASPRNSTTSTKTKPMISQGNFATDLGTNLSAPGTDGMDELNGLFSPSILASVSSNSEKDYMNFNQQGKSPAAGSLRSKVSEQANSDANSNSPASSANNGFTSSCVTTPEYSAESPEQRKAGEAAFSSIGATSQRRKSSVSHEAFSSTANSTGQPHTPLTDGQGFDWFATQNGGAFDPVLFGDYRDPQTNIMSGDYGGFFQDAFDFTAEPQVSPLETSLPKKRDLMKEIEEQQAGKETEVVPGEHPKQFLTCNMLWDRVQRSEKVQNGEADMDELCSQLKAKAKCSGNGAVIDQKDVDAILGPAPDDTKDFFKMFK